MIAHPLLSTPARRLKRYFWILLLPPAICMTVFYLTSDGLSNETAPLGIMSLELHSSNTATVEKILKSWNWQTRQWGAFSLGFDYCFIVFYTLSITTGCIWAARHFNPESTTFRLGVALAWSPFIGAFFDWIENAALLLVLIDERSDLAWVGALSGLVKWVAVLTGIAYVLVSGIIIFFKRKPL